MYDSRRYRLYGFGNISTRTRRKMLVRQLFVFAKACEQETGTRGGVHKEEWTTPKYRGSYSRFKQKSKETAKDGWDKQRGDYLELKKERRWNITVDSSRKPSNNIVWIDMAGHVKIEPYKEQIMINNDTHWAPTF